MKRSEFENDVRAQGYEIVERHMEANNFNPEHAHEFDARLLMLDGEMTIACGGEERTYRAGDSCAIDAGQRHTERSGPAGAHYLAGRRYPG